MPKPFISSEEIFEGLAPATVLELERLHGNTDLVRVFEYAGFAGPFTAVTPWELAAPDGNTVINASGYAANPFGDRYPPLKKFLSRLIEEDCQQSLPQQSTSAWRSALEANLVQTIASVDESHADSRVFFSNSGSEAIEAAIKFAKASRQDATTFINFEKSFHGKTTGSLSLTANEDSQRPFRPLAYKTLTLPFGDLPAFEQAIKTYGGKNFIAVVVEPVQGEGGIIVPPEGFLSGIDEIAKKHGILVIADEIQSGFGRSGYWVPSVEWGEMSPDIFTFAKPLGGGIVPIGATVARKNVFAKMLGGLRCKTHSNTFGGNSLAMAVGLKSLEIIRDENLVERSRKLGAVGLSRLQALAMRHPDLIEDVRGIGMWQAIVFKPVVPAAVALGMKDVIGEFTTMLGMMMLHRAGVHANIAINAHRTVRLTPPLTIPEALHNEMFDRIDTAAEQMKSARRMLLKTPPKSLFDLTRVSVGL